MSGTLNEQLQQIADTKDAIAQAISGKGVEVTPEDSFASYALKINEIQGGSGNTTSIAGFNSFDLKVTDRLLNEQESKGWARVGSIIKKSDNADFYNKCLQEYRESIVGKGYISANVTIIGDLTEYKGLLSGFVSGKSGAKFLKTVPSTVTSFEMVAKISVSENHTTYKAIYCQPETTNYTTPQFEIGTAGKLQVAVSKSGSSWDCSVQDTEQCLGQTLWVKCILKDGVLSLLKSFDGKDYKLIGTVDNVERCNWTAGIGVGVDGNNASHALDGGTIDLMECYIDINGERWWNGCDTFEVMEYENGHKYATPDKQEYIDKYYKKFGYADFYMIDEENEQVTLPRLIEPECTYVYFCTATQAQQDIVIDLSKEVELNTPFFLGQSQYFENEPNNVSWLKSSIEFYPKAVYPSMYNYISENVKAGTKDFATINSEYDDYSYVLDEENETFRLPLLNGSEKKFSDERRIDLDFTSKDITVIAPANGWYFCSCIAGTTSAHLSIARNPNGDFASQPSYRIPGASTSGTAVFTSLEVNRGEEIRIYGNPTGTIQYCSFYYNTGNGSLYYYVGEAINNANIVDLGKIQAQLTTKLDLSTIKYDSATSTLYIGAV